MNVLFTHNDLDGIGCAMIGRLLGCFDEIHYCSYTSSSKQYYVAIINEAMARLENVDVVYLTDISLTQEIYDQIKDCLTKAKAVVWYDHHDSSQTVANAGVFKTIKFSLNDSATLQFYNSFRESFPHLEQYDVTFRAINAYDTWNFALSPVAKDLQRVYDYSVFQDPNGRYIKFQKKVKNFTEYLLNDPIISDLPNMYPMWMNSCLNLYNSRVFTKVQNVIDNNIKYDGRVAIVSAPDEDNVPVFELSWYMTDKHPDIKYVIYNIFKDDGTSYLSLRFSSLDPEEAADKDLSSIAERYGGGGHIKASAFRLETEKANEAIVEIVKELQ